MDPYEILNISKNATKAEIRTAYKKMAMKYHPDKNNSSKESEDKFKEVSKAYYMLINDEIPNNFNKYDFNNIFENLKTNINVENITKSFIKEATLFSQFFKNKQEKISNKSITDDININVNIDLIDIYNGIIKTFDYPRTIKCKICLGLGFKVNSGEYKDGAKCNGTKYIDDNVTIKINSNEKMVVLPNKSNEEIGKKTGNINIRIYPKINIDTPNIINIINQYDLLYQIPIDFRNTNIEIIKKNINLFNNAINIDIEFTKPFTSEIYTYQNLGLLKPFPNENDNIRGNLLIQLIQTTII